MMDSLVLRARPPARGAAHRAHPTFGQALADRCDGLAPHAACHPDLARATARPAFVRALAGPMAHFSAADATVPPPAAGTAGPRAG